MPAKKPPAKKPAGKVTRVVTVSTNIGTGCKHCSNQPVGLDHFEEGINHYIQAHDYTLLHVGQQTGMDFKDRPYQSTVAVLGHP